MVSKHLYCKFVNDLLMSFIKVIIFMVASSVIRGYCHGDAICLTSVSKQLTS